MKWAWGKDKVHHSYHLKVGGIWLGTVSQCFDKKGNMSNDSAWSGYLSGEMSRGATEYPNMEAAKLMVEERALEILKEAIT